MLEGYRWALRYAARHRGRLTFSLLLGVATSAMEVAHPWPMKLLVDSALSGAPVPPVLHGLLGRLSIDPGPFGIAVIAALATVAIFGANSLIDIGANWTRAVVSQRMAHDVAADLFDRLQRLSMVFHSRRSVGEWLNRVTGDAWSAFSVTEALVLSPWQNVVTLAAVGLTAWWLDPVLAALSLGVAPVLAASAAFFGRKLKGRTRIEREVRSRLMSHVQQTIAAGPLIQAFGTEGRHAGDYRRLATELLEASRRRMMVKRSYGMASGLITSLGTAVVLFTGGLRVLSGTLSIGSLIALLAYLRTMQAALQRLLDIYGDLKSFEVSIERIREVFDGTGEVREAAGARPLPSRQGPARGQVRFEEVTFGYEPGRPVLHGVTLEVRAGETLAVVGPTGAGKSTLVSLVPRFVDPWAGRVLLSGVDVRTAQLASVRAHVALVLQEAFLLPLTVAENIAYGRPGATFPEIQAAAVAARADDFIRQLPAGYNTVIGERGATLSGGERQRLAIARALLKDAPILILDEPTAALDAQTEALVLDAMERLMDGRTTIVIAHRLSTVRRADRIVVLQHGRIAEAGTHHELLAAGGPYRRLVALQASSGSGNQVGS